MTKVTVKGRFTSKFRSLRNIAIPSPRLNAVL